MTREEAKQYVLQQEPTFLQKAKKIGYVCPVCGNGSGKDGTGITLNPRNKMHPHYSCFTCKAMGKIGNYDIFELYAEHNHLDNNSIETFDSVYDYYKITVDALDNDRSVYKPHTEPVKEKAIEVSKEALKTDYIGYYKACMSANDYSYLQARGISESIQKKFMIGYDANWTHPKAPNTPKTPRCIIPSSRYTYLARDVRKEIPKEQEQYAKSKVGNDAPPFNINAINKENEIIFIVEGEIDAMSIEEVGYSAIGLGGAYKTNALLEELKKKYKNQVFIILADVDNNGTGDKARETLEKGFAELGVNYIVGSLKYHDPNEALQKDRAYLEKETKELYKKAVEKKKIAENEYCASELMEYFKNIEAYGNTCEVPTGFNQLDYDFFGGLHEGLYIIGAISSLGKTTFSLQIADQIAKGGHDVLFFSLEMSKYELISKSISRYTYINEKNKVIMPSGISLAKDTQHIMNSKYHKAYCEAEKNAIKKAIDCYEKEVSSNMYIYEGRCGGQRLNADHIKQIVRNHIKRTGRKPVVMVDYLQILAPINEHMTDKQSTDASVFILKEITKEHNIPVFAISSFNRENYNAPVSMQSFKESGAIEYSSDVLLGLQLYGMERVNKEGKDGNPRNETDAEYNTRIDKVKKQMEQDQREKKPIKMVLKCLKNRNGYKFSLSLECISAYNVFWELDETKQKQAQKTLFS